MAKSRGRSSVQRRNFLKGATLAGAAALAAPLETEAHPSPRAGAVVLPRPNLAAETLPPPKDPITQTTGGADFMVDVIKTLGFDYIATNPASSFRAVHESFVNYGKNTKPELLTCVHEEIAVAMAHGYAKIEGKPMGVLAHGTVGLHHAVMALYNAWCDRVPVYMMIGNMVDANKRGSYVEWTHSAQDPVSVARDFVKWDDQPGSLQHFAESAVRAYALAMTPPMGPVVLSLDTELQENPIPDGEPLSIPKLPRMTMPQGDSGAVAETARLLVAAENPVIVADRLSRTPAGMGLMVELAETLQCAVIDRGGRTNFPSRHPLNQTSRGAASVVQADLVLGLELNDFWGSLHSTRDQIVRRAAAITRPGTKTIHIGTGDLFVKANYQDFQRFAGVDLSVEGDGEATMPALIEAVKKLVGQDRRAAFEARGKKLAAQHQAAFDEARAQAAAGWDASPITTARFCAELYEQIRTEDWSLLDTGVMVGWPKRLWDIDKPYRTNGNPGGYGEGGRPPQALGAALANRQYGRLSVIIVGDGNLMFTPGTLWTAAHHHIPILFVVHNNRAYHQEVMYVQAQAARHSRGIENAHIGTTLTDPMIDFAGLARSFGVHGEGPVEHPRDLAPALQRAIAVVKRGEPALIDIVSEGR